MNPTAGKGLSIAAISLLLAAISANFGVFESAGNVLSGWLGRPQFVAVVVGIAAGVGLTTWVPYVFGGVCVDLHDLQRQIDEAPAEAKQRLIDRAKRVERLKMLVRLSSSTLGFAVAWRMSPTETGALYALLALFAAPQAYNVLTRTTYLLFPALKPQVLKQTAPQLVAQAADIPTEGAPSPEADHA